MKIEEIFEAIQDDRIRITDHAVEEAENDQLTLDEDCPLYMWAK